MSGKNVDGITYSVTPDGVAHVVLNRPARKNALDRPMMKALAASLRGPCADPSVGAVLLHGAGDSFCTGADLHDLASCETPDAAAAFFRDVADAVRAVATCAVPVIAKVRGAAFAGGLGLVSASDVVVASTDARFGLPEIHRGIVPMIVTAPLARSLGRKVLADLVLTGDPIDAERAYSLGLVSRLYPSADLDPGADALARRLAASSAPAKKAAKSVLSTAGDADVLGALDALADRVALLASGGDAKERMASFLEKKA